MRNLDQSTRLEPKMTILGDVACCGSEERTSFLELEIEISDSRFLKVDSRVEFAQDSGLVLRT